ncbi:PUA domain-containing protein, partial [Mesorhizobium ciceri]|uniref:PUA domain-containing protein n=1 Tax=Mesorhizobium ciceri TaxID=39645 RepID=UPI00344D8DE1
ARVRPIDRGARATCLRPPSTPATGNKPGSAGQRAPAGRLTVDAGAIGALLSGKSLLPAGVKLVSGNFSRGDTVAILSPEGREIARGLVAYDAADAVRIAGLKTAEIETVLGYEARSAMIHRDDLVVSHSGDQVRAGDQKGAGDQVTVGGDVNGG